MFIREERAIDIEPIRQVLQQAFTNQPHSNGLEYAVVEALRAADALEVALVAEVSNVVVGYIAFSRVAISTGAGGWYGLGPVGVLPVHQSQGIGEALIREGLTRIQSKGAVGCVVLGEPEYYSRFGFKARPELKLEGVPAEYFLALPFGDSIPRGDVGYHEAFKQVS